MKLLPPRWQKGLWRDLPYRLRELRYRKIAPAAGVNRDRFSEAVL
jgi:hypothetical protein